MSATLVIPTAVLRSIPANQQKLCQRVWLQYVTKERRETIASFVDPATMGQWFQEYAALVAQAEREGHARNSGDVAYQRRLERSHAHVTQNKPKWAVQFATCGDPRKWNEWPRFVPTLQDAIGMLWEEFCVMPGAFVAPPSVSADSARPIIRPTEYREHPPNYLAP